MHQPLWISPLYRDRYNRNTTSTHMPHNQADLRHIQAILGYTQITSTEFYTHLALEDLKEEVRRSHPHGKKRKDLE